MDDEDVEIVYLAGDEDEEMDDEEEEVEVQVIAVSDENAQVIESQKVNPYVEFVDVNDKKVTIINWDHPYW